MKNLITIILFLAGGALTAQTSLNGKVTEGNTDIGAAFANVTLYQGIDFVTGTQTDFDGFYNFSNLDSGTYNVEVSYAGFQTVRITNMIVYGSKANNLDAKIEVRKSSEEKKKVIKAPIQKLSPRSGQCLNSEQLKKLPVRRLAAIVPGVVGLSSNEENEIYMKGGERVPFYMNYDGPRIRGTLIPEEIDTSELEELLGGTPASEY